MRVAIIGGGSAGLITAHLLDRHHEVTVLEREPIAGGHVRTLGGNVASPLDPAVRLDAGVVEFEVRNFPTLMRLFERLGCPTRPVAGTTTFYTRDGVHHLSPGTVQRAADPWPRRLGQIVDVIRLAMQGRRCNRRMEAAAPHLPALRLGEVLAEEDADRWAALLAMYAHSIPYERVRQLPAELVVPMLQAFERAESWVSLVGGAWTYHARILDQLEGELRVEQRVQAVHRDARGVRIEVAGRPAERFDKVVFACPPDQTLHLLAEPTEAERRRFGAWRANHVHTLVHDDVGPYRRRGIHVATEFDVFELPGGRGAYNAYLNDLAGLPPGGPQYGLAFGMDDEIDPARVIHRQEHHTPDYTVEAYRWHCEIDETNGERHTLHAGAWLGDGLQEGAVRSALAVAEKLGGASL